MEEPDVEVFLLNELLIRERSMLTFADTKGIENVSFWKSS